MLDKLSSVAESVRNWDSKTLLAALFLAGYFALVYFLPDQMKGLNEAQQRVIDKLIDPLGPVIGIIAFAIWRTSQRDNVEVVTNAHIARENAETVKAIATGATPPPPATPAGSDPWDAKS